MRDTETKSLTRERLAEAQEDIETAASVLSAIVPGSAVAELASGVQSEDAGAVWAAVPLVALDAASGGKGKASRNTWTLTKEGASVIKSHTTFGTIYKSLSDGLWWAKDRAGHGGSKFKVFKETKGGLEWHKDADEFGDFILNKLKGETGKFIPWNQLKTVK